MQASGIPLAEIAYVGDDLTDIVVMRRVGLAIATANARAEVKRAAHYVTIGVRRTRGDSRSGGAAASARTAAGPIS